MAAYLLPAQTSQGQTAQTQAEQEWWTEAFVVPAVGQTPPGQWTITDLMMT